MSSIHTLLLASTATLIYLVLRRLFLVLVSHRSLLRHPSLHPLCPFSNLVYVAHNLRLQNTTRTEHLYAQHRKQPIIRLGPDRISFSSPHAIRDIYGTNTVCSKGDQYSTPGGTPSLLSVVDRHWHAAKRKRMSAAFATSHLVDWQDKVVDKLVKLVRVMDDRCAHPGAACGATVDMRFWSHLFTLDTIMDIALSYRSGYLDRGTDTIEAEPVDGQRKPVSLRDCLFAVNRSIGPIVWSKAAYPALKRLCGFFPSARHQQHLAALWVDVARFLARERVMRDKHGEQLDDLFACLLRDKADRTLELSEDELVAETAHLVDAGSDTTSITLTHTLYCLLKNPEQLEKLRAELDKAVDPEQTIPRYEQIRHLPFLKACIDESMRLRPALSAGLQRETPAKGAVIAGEAIPGHTFVSVPAFVAHRDPVIYPEPELFLPERWLSQSGPQLQRYALTFSTGGRVCIGKNIAYIELSMALGCLVRRYDFELPTPKWTISWEEHFNMWPKELPLRLTRRTLV